VLPGTSAVTQLRTAPLDACYNDDSVRYTGYASYERDLISYSIPGRLRSLHSLWTRSTIIIQRKRFSDAGCRHTMRSGLVSYIVSDFVLAVPARRHSGQGGAGFSLRLPAT
jgi:hypothetical protein